MFRLYPLALLIFVQATVAYAAAHNLTEQLPEFWLLTVVSGVGGGIMNFFYNHQNSGMKLWPAGVMTVLSGAVVSAFASPFALVFLGDWLPGDHLVGATRAMLMGFVVGIIGIDLVGWILKLTAMRTRQVERENDP